MQCVFEFPDLYFGLVPGDAVAFMQLSDQVVGVAVELGYVAIGELAPFFLGLALQLQLRAPDAATGP